MKNLSLLFILSVFFLSSCTPENRIYEKHQQLSPDVEWLKTDVRTFQVNIEDISKSYAFNIAFRYAQGFPWDKALIVLEETSPSGLKKRIPYSLAIRDSEGNYMDEAGYDIWDSTHLVDPQKRYEEKGTYTYTLSHEMPRDDFPFAMEIGLIIDYNL